MIDVNATPFAKNLLGIAFGTIAFNQAQNKKQLDAILKEKAKQEQLKEQFKVWDDLNFQITTEVIDKRFKSSKMFRETGLKTEPLQIKKSVSEEQRALQIYTEQQMMKSRMLFEKQASRYNQKILDQKIKTQSRKIDLSAILKQVR